MRHRILRQNADRRSGDTGKALLPIAHAPLVSILFWPCHAPGAMHKAAAGATALQPSVPPPDPQALGMRPAEAWEAVARTLGIEGATGQELYEKVGAAVR